MPACWRRAISASQVAEVCRRPTAADSWSTKDWTPREMRLTPWRRSSARVSSESWPGAHSRVISAVGLSWKVWRSWLKILPDEVGWEEAGGAAAEVEGVDVGGEGGAEAGGCLGCVGDLLADLVDVGGHLAPGEGVGAEVAEGALRLAERDGEVEAEVVGGGAARHRFIVSRP